MSKVTKAPPPISPVSGRGGAFVRRRPAATPPKWEWWARLGNVLPWEAAALFVGIEPGSVNQWQRETFPDDDTFERFEWYCRIIKSKTPATGHSSPCANLSALASWALSEGLGIPDELRRMAVAAPCVAEAAPPTGTPSPDATARPEEVPAAPPASSARAATEYATTARICEAFPHPKTVKPQNWETGRFLSDCPAWLKSARVSAGKRGVSAMWSPAQFALCMVSERHIRKGQAATIVSREFPAWLDEWERITEFLE
ncbi:hypothetical protein [Azoarcus sp. KH32C]|uniref:hypothetical protein n=1 Tax=Azoarcus sp. KH32C TaxID=748247 RepID=UPI0002385FE1|nr:hypothetical protein [Azoarcus sp. KH32C]BAL24011.1 hypothetical protein AZKH_1696 [Azoarcus sp. KH32C]